MSRPRPSSGHRPHMTPPTKAQKAPPGWLRPGAGLTSCPRGLPGYTNQRTPCWLSAVSRAPPSPAGLRARSSRWRDPDEVVPGPELGNFPAPCFYCSVISSGAMAREVTPRLLAPRATRARCYIAVSSTNTASRDRIWCRSMGTCPSGSTRGVSRGRGWGAGFPPCISAFHLRSGVLRPGTSRCTPYVLWRGLWAATPCGPYGPQVSLPVPEFLPLLSLIPLLSLLL